jgi:hypothetical protein
MSQVIAPSITPAAQARYAVGRKMDKQYVYRILKNQLYLGKIVHKDNVYDGQHEAIIFARAV